MKALATALPDILLFQPSIHRDDRGCFLECWNQRVFDELLGRPVRFVQDNRSRSRRGVLRGLHFQIDPTAQAKLVTVMNGRIFDVAVDLRPSSPTYGKWLGEELCGDECAALWIPEGFAHGFLVLSETADVLYKTTDFYSPKHERCIRWDDPTLGIDWPLGDLMPLVSPKDALGESFKT
jgi:dTDP-4-dehydrorhamnose 3,5-epimerase